MFKVTENVFTKPPTKKHELLKTITKNILKKTQVTVDLFLIYGWTSLHMFC